MSALAAPPPSPALPRAAKRKTVQAESGIVSFADPALQSGSSNRTVEAVVKFSTLFLEIPFVNFTLREYSF